MVWLREGIRMLPNILQDLELNLSYNLIGDNGVELLVDGMKYLPINLKNLAYKLNCNMIGRNGKDLTWFGKGMS